MRRLTDVARLRRLMQRLGAEAHGEMRVYLTGGATALLYGWRSSTVDVDLKLEPDSDPMLQSLPRLKEDLELNIELASPGDFIPELPGWRERSPFIVREGPVDFHHYDLYAQALAKLERAHALDLADVREMIARGLVEPARAQELFERIVPDLYRYPAIDPAAFRRSVTSFLARA